MKIFSSFLTAAAVGIGFFSAVAAANASNTDVSLAGFIATIGVVAEVFLLIASEKVLVNA